jgi:hypothetical protein
MLKYWRNSFLCCRPFPSAMFWRSTLQPLQSEISIENVYLAGPGQSALTRHQQVRANPARLQASRMERRTARSTPAPRMFSFRTFPKKVDIFPPPTFNLRPHTLFLVPFNFSFSAARSASTIMAINSSNFTLGCHPSSFLALPASPMSRSTSVGR